MDSHTVRKAARSELFAIGICEVDFELDVRSQLTFQRMWLTFAVMVTVLRPIDDTGTLCRQIEQPMFERPKTATRRTDIAVYFRITDPLRDARVPRRERFGLGRHHIAPGRLGPVRRDRPGTTLRDRMTVDGSGTVRAQVMFRSSWLHRAPALLPAAAAQRGDEAFVRRLALELRRRGFDALGGPWARDWGWRAAGQSDDASVTIDIVLLDGEGHDWIVSAELSGACKAGSKGPSPTTWQRLMLAFELLLTSEQGIFDVHWYR